MRVLFFGNFGVLHRKGEPSPSSVVRVTNVAKILEKHGYDCTVDYVRASSYQQNKVDILNSEAVIFHRIQSSHKTWVESSFLPLYILAKKHRKKVVFDLDDALFLTFPLTCSLCTRLADIVFAGSHLLVSYARLLNPKTFLMPSAVDTDVFHPFESAPKDRLVVGWHGTARGHFRNLKLLRPVLSRLSTEYSLIFRLLGSEGDRTVQDFFRIRCLETDFGPREWITYDKLPFYLKDVDIGVSPLTDNLWNRGKCAMKAIEYMALGKPVVVSAVGEQKYVIRRGVDGFLAVDNDEWVIALSELIQNAKLRRRLGKEARRTATSFYSLEKISRRVGNLLETV